VAYLTCPWCLTPQQVGDESIEYRCFTCAAENGFLACPDCGYRQTVSKKWTAVTCGKCEKKVDLPRRWGYAIGTRAYQVQGPGQPWPKF
jgi:DNA-directed RNA polymerase subunit RPC12/RpoP